MTAVYRIVAIALSALVLGVLSTEAIAEPAPKAYQDGRNIPRLQWAAPPGVMPGTHEGYLKSHPPTRAEFSTALLGPVRLASPASSQSSSESLSILVDATLYPLIQIRLNEYVADLAAIDVPAHVETVAGGTPESIKAWVKSRYDAGNKGVLFVGDIVAAWAEVSGSVFPCDLFYMDLDGSWVDADRDGIYESHSAGLGDEGPEVFVTRINAHTLHYDTEANMVNGYFAKACAYRAGTLTQPWRGVEYIEEDWYDMDVALDQVYSDRITRKDSGYFTTGTDYLDWLDSGRHFVQVCVHSWSQGHAFGRRPTESAAYAHVYVYSPATRSARLLLGSDDGIKAWLNGSVVSLHDVYQGWSADQFNEPVTLQAGWNRLLCKISQGGSSFRFSGRFANAALEPFSDLTYQLDDPLLYGTEAPFISCWLVNGFHQDSSERFWSYLTTNYLGVDEGSVNPQAGDGMAGNIWTAYGDGAYVDLDLCCGGKDFGVSYAFVRVTAAVAMACELWLGYDDGVRAWLNGQQVCHDNRYGEYSPDMTKVPVQLVAGENRLLVKVSEWMGAGGFSARFCTSAGNVVQGLVYDPEPEHGLFIGDWLVNGPYPNAEQSTRLSQDYLGNEAGIRPFDGASAPLNEWEVYRGDGEPVDLGVHYDQTEYVESDDIQERDPPVLFYNLFACGPGRFTDADYLAGAYIFNTTYGLISVASSKSGSMLNFNDFTTPLGQGESIGAAFLAWFDAQAPFELWEKEWYYGMVLCGDPILRVSGAGAKLALDSRSPGAGGFTVKWPSLAGWGPYTLLSTTNLLVNFKVERTGILATPPINVHTVDVTTVKQKFYRLEYSLPPE